MTLYGPDFVVGDDSIGAAVAHLLGRLVEDLLAGATPAAGSVTDAKVAADAAIAQSKIAGLVADLAARATDAELAALDVAVTAALALKAPSTGIAQAAITNLVDDLAAKATPAEIAAAIAALVDSSPATLDTLNELAAALGDDANFATTVTNAIATRADAAATTAALAGKQATIPAGTYAPFAETAARIAADATKASKVVAETYAQRREQIDSAPEFYSDFANLDGLKTNANATVVGGRFASTVDGTVADAILPLYGPIRSARWSFPVKAAKTGTALNKSGVGFTIGIQPGTLPAGGYPTGAVAYVGYLQGTGMVILRDNISTNTTVVADAALTDGTDYIIECGYEDDLSRGLPFGSSAYFYVIVRTLAGVLVASTSSGMSEAWGAMSNLLIRTNSVAGGIRNLAFKAHGLGALRRNGPAVSTPQFFIDAAAQPVMIRVPTVPLRPYRVAVFCHGYGQSVYNSGTAGSVQNPLIEALERAGFITVTHNFHGNAWANDSAHAALVAIYNAIVARYGADTEFFMVGESMGAALAASAVAEGTIPVKAVVAIDGVFDLVWTRAQAAYTASIDAAYPGGAGTYNSPLGYSAASYGTVPFWISASASDTAILKANNSDAFKALLGAQVTQVLTAGAHSTASHYDPPTAMVNFLLATFA